MPRAKRPPVEFDVDLLVAGEATASGNVYPPEIIEQLVEKINETPVTIEEVSPVERKAHKVPVCYSWPEHAMAVSTKAVCADGHLVITFALKTNKYGKLLKKTMEENAVVFKPVGIGDTDESGTITKYTLVYVTFRVVNGSD